MKTHLLHGRSGAQPRFTRLRLAGFAALLALAGTAPAAFAQTATPKPRSHDVSAAPATSVVASFEPSALPDTGNVGALRSASPLPANPADNRIQNMLRAALALLGTPYRWGGTTPQGFDCSGLVGYVFRTSLGIELPRVSRDIATRGQRVQRDQLAEGDLVFFSRSGGTIDHVGIYVGNGQFLHAPRTGRDVSVSRLDTGYWAGKFMQARRIAEARH